MFRFFMNRRYVNLYFSMQKKGNIHELSKEVDMTTSHLSIVTDQLEKEGLIIKNRKGREVSIELTELGKRFGEILKEYNELALGQLNKKKEEVIIKESSKGRSK